MKVLTLQNHYNMNIIKYKVKYILYLKIFYRQRKRGCLLLFWGIFSSHPEGTFDVILMDIMMPVMNGYEAAKMIRSLDREDAKVIPIIAMTANAFTEDKMRAKEAGMDEHIAKPVDGKLLVKVINELVKRDQREKL